MSPFHRHALAGLVAASFVAGCHSPSTGPVDTSATDYLRIVAAEDARPTGGADLETLLEAEHDTSALVRAAAVRALGRLENPALVAHIAPLLTDPDTAVRARAADAMAQAVFRGSGGGVAPTLLDRVETERDPRVRGVLARSIGRLRLDDETRGRVARALIALSHNGHDGAEGDAPPEQLLGVVLGMESFARGRHGGAPDTALVGRLRELALRGWDRTGAPGARETADAPTPETSTRSSRIRELAVMALASARALDSTVVDAAMRDPAVGVRIAAFSGVLLPRGAPAPTPGQGPKAQAYRALALRAFGDPSPQVRALGVRALARSTPDTTTCRRLRATAAHDPDTGVRVAALDGLGRPCPARGTQVAQLAATARSLAADSLTWHAPAHALLALAHVDPPRARQLLPSFADHADPFVRVYAAEAASAAGDTALLMSLSRDSVPNVRTAAVQGLSALQGREADTVLVRTLAGARDPQLVLTVAHLLNDDVGVGRSEFRRRVAQVALETLDRISRAREETLRDARLALLGLAGDVGAPAPASAVGARGPERPAPDSTLLEGLARYLVDYDPAVADSAALILHRWTETAYDAEPHPLPRLPLPTPDELRAMEHATVVLQMARGGTMEIRLLPLVAPTNAFRLYQQAGSGVLDGRTFHRVVPDFVIQGGSPDANEYSGNGAFTRDELDLSVQWRGTVGLSTRGRDTGDGQFYVNLVDNVRLNHDYTVFGVVTGGMDVADAVLEGDVIRHAEVRIRR